MRSYRSGEVSALAESLGRKAQPAPPRGQRRRDNYEDGSMSDNPFDGLTREDAAGLLYDLTGIVDSSVANGDDW